MVTKEIYLPIFKSSFGSIDWHIPIILRTVGKERIRKRIDINKELPKLFLEKLQQHHITNERDTQSVIEDWKSLHYDGLTYEGRNASKRYLIVQLYSLAIPSAINLGLISQQHPNEMLTFLGRKLLKTLDEDNVDLISDSEESMNVLRQICLWQDKNWKIFSAIQKSSEPTKLEILKQLEKMNVLTPLNMDKLYKKTRIEILKEFREQGRLRNSKDTIRLKPKIEEQIKLKLNDKVIPAKLNILENLLSLYSNLELIYREKNLYLKNEKMISSLETKSTWNTIVTSDEINKTICKILDKFQTEKKTTVAIPIIRDYACEQLDIPWTIFNAKLTELVLNSETSHLTFSRAISPKKWGLPIGKINYYYMSLRK